MMFSEWVIYKCVCGKYNNEIYMLFFYIFLLYNMIVDSVREATFVVLGVILSCTVLKYQNTMH